MFSLRTEGQIMCSIVITGNVCWLPIQFPYTYVNICNIYVCFITYFSIESYREVCGFIHAIMGCLCLQAFFSPSFFDFTVSVVFTDASSRNPYQHTHSSPHLKYPRHPTLLSIYLLCPCVRLARRQLFRHSVFLWRLGTPGCRRPENRGRFIQTQ